MYFSLYSSAPLLLSCSWITATLQTAMTERSSTLSWRKESTNSRSALIYPKGLVAPAISGLLVSLQESQLLFSFSTWIISHWTSHKMIEFGQNFSQRIKKLVSYYFQSFYCNYLKVYNTMLHRSSQTFVYFAPSVKHNFTNWMKKVSVFSLELG